VRSDYIFFVPSRACRNLLGFCLFAGWLFFLTLLIVFAERDSNKNERDRVQEQIDLAEQTIGSQQAEIQKLNHIISEAEAERLSQKKDYERVKDERDILASQLQRRVDELALLQEKIKLQQSTLNAGEAAYNQRLDDLRVLKLKVKDRERELALVKGHSNDADALKQRVYSLERQLLQERTKGNVARGWQPLFSCVLCSFRTCFFLI
jgi:cilia- and flagella-associated protein 58